MGLNAKTYYCYDNTDAKNNKYSSKGVSHSCGLTKEDYLKVLKNESIEQQENKGFVYKNNKMYSYLMKKQGLTNCYCKRKLLNNGLSTTYLDV